MTRRTNRRQYLLRPSPEVNNALEYVFAASAMYYGIIAYAWCFMSTHYHSGLFDPFGAVVEFTRDVHAMSSRCINSLHGEFDSVWNGSRPSRVEMLRAPDVIDGITYTMANPVEAGAVEQGEQWPGVWAAWSRTQPRQLTRPALFRDENPLRWPEELTFGPSRPPGFGGRSDDELAQWIDREYHRKLEAHWAEARSAGRSFLGADKVLATPRTRTATRYEKRFQLSPRVKCKDKPTRLRWIKRFLKFVFDHVAAMKEWQAGNRDVVFPWGTYQMRLVHNVRVAPPPPLDYDPFEAFEPAPT